MNDFEIVADDLQAIEIVKQNTTSKQEFF